VKGKVKIKITRATATNETTCQRRHQGRKRCQEKRTRSPKNTFMLAGSCCNCKKNNKKNERGQSAGLSAVRDFYGSAVVPALSFSDVFSIDVKPVVAVTLSVLS
jgi:hypothetical protein